MQRRTFMLLLGTNAVLPLGAFAQQKPMPVIGFLHSAARQEISDLLEAFRIGLKESGFAEGQNAALEYRYGENQRDRLAPLAEELVARKVDVIATGGGDRTAIAAKQKDVGHSHRIRHRR
jgi:putative ABC transport system substrate-binding protein